MPVLINFKICDNSEDCNGIRACPSGAFHWDRKGKTIAVDEERCIDCGKCADACDVGAIRFAKDQEEARRIKKEIDRDPRRASDLFIDRYGSEPVGRTYNLPQRRFEKLVLKSGKFSVIELFDDGSIECLLNSIPVRELLRDIDTFYRKVRVEKESILKKFGVRKLPCLLVFNRGKLAGKIEGYYDITRKEELRKKIEKILDSME